MSISAKTIADLRAQTGAGIMDCKKALAETDGDMAKAVEYLQKKSLAAVGKRADKVAAEGAVGSYIHDGRIGVLVELNCETDFVGRGEDFQKLLKDIAMHIAAMNPTYLDASEIPADVTAKQREIFAARNEGKPAAMMDKIVDGQIRKWHSDVCLLQQEFFKEEKKTVADIVTEVAAVIKENIKVRRFVRFELGAGIVREATDFAAEVAATAGV